MTILPALFLFFAYGPSDGSAPRLLPVYAHNDYQNQTPLAGALELGFRGVEVDYFVVDGELRVGHELSHTQPGRTVEALYLAPLRERVRRYGGVYPECEEFILNIESKREGMETYEALHELLSRYDDILSVVRDGVAEPGPVQVILVGWHPSLDYLWNQSVRYAAVQVHYQTLPDDHARYPSHLLKLISQNYEEKRLTRGNEPVPPRLRCRLDKLDAAARLVPGRLVRVYNVPTNGPTYEALLEAGVDLIGTKDIEGAYDLLRD